MPDTDLTPIAHEHLKRELLKEVPLVGKILEAMTWGVVDDAKKAADKAKLYDTLNAHTTDLGDILNTLREQREFSLQMQEAIAVLTRYFEGTPTAHDVITVESVAVKAKVTSEPLKIFISFAKEDEAIVAELKTTLKPLTRQNGVTVWTFHDIPVGADWDAKIKEALASTSIVFLIISRNFLASDYIHENELPEILRRAEEGTVLPFTIFASPVAKNPTKDIRRYQALNDPNKSLLAMSEVEKEQFWVKVYESVENPR